MVRQKSGTELERLPGRGSVLILTLIIVVVLSVIVLSVADFVMSGLKSSDVTTQRTASNNATSSALTWTIDAFAAKDIQIAAECPGPGSTIIVPPGAVAEGGSAVVTCTPIDEIDFHPTVLLEAVGTTVDGVERSITVVLQIPQRKFGAQVRSWTVD